MTTSSLAITRRIRRRRQIAVLLTIAVIVAVLALAVRYRTEQRETAEYLALLDEIAKGELAVAEGLRGVFSALGDLDRPDIVSRVEALNGQARQLEIRLADAAVSRPVATVHGYVSVAVTAWSEGLGTLDEALVEVMDSGETAVDPSSLLASSVGSLVLGDAAYEHFLAAVPDLAEEYDPPAYPEVSFVSGADLQDITDRLILSGNLKERHDVAVTVNTSPEPTGSAGDVLVMPFASTFDVTAIVTNPGNVIEEGIEVLLRLTPDGDVGEPFSEPRIIPSLRPGEAVTLDFVGIPLEPETIYTLNVTVSIADDAEVANNVLEILFATNAA